jgi:hypothetical protein
MSRSGSEPAVTTCGHITEIFYKYHISCNMRKCWFACVQWFHSRWSWYKSVCFKKQTTQYTSFNTLTNLPNNESITNLNHKISYKALQKQMERISKYDPKKYQPRERKWLERSLKWCKFIILYIFPVSLIMLRGKFITISSISLHLSPKYCSIVVSTSPGDASQQSATLAVFHYFHVPPGKYWYIILKQPELC